MKEDPDAEANTVFTLYEDRETAMSEHEGVAVFYALYFNEPLRGLAAGAPVTLHGLPVGKVTAVALEPYESPAEFRPRVEIAVYPGRFIRDTQSGKDIETQPGNREACHAYLHRLINRGLRAQLRSGNLLLGQLFIAFDFFPQAPPARVNWSREMPVLPVMPGSPGDIENKIGSIITQMEKIPFAVIGEELSATLASLNEAIADIRRAAVRIDCELIPEARASMEDLRRTLAAAERILSSGERTLAGPDAPVQQELREALQEIARAARAVRVFAEYMEQNPGALLRGKTQEAPK